MALRTVVSLIGVGAITASHIGTGAIGSDELGAGAVADATKFGAGAVDAAAIATGAVGADEIGTGAVAADEIAAGAVSEAKMAAGVIKYTTVVAATDADVANLAAGAPNPVDGVNVAQNDDILAWKQATGSQNGIYNVDTVGTGVNGAWTRAAERDVAAELPVGLMIYVKGGTKHGGKVIKLKTFAGTLGTDPITFDEHVEGLTPSTSTGEMEAVGVGNGSNLNFDLDVSKVAFIAVFVEGLQQDPANFSIAAGAGTGGVDQLQFGAGNAPANGASIEAIVLQRV